MRHKFLDGDIAESAEAAECLRAPRFSRLLSAVCNGDKSGDFKLVVRNISRNGIGGRSSVKLCLGEKVTVHLPGHDTFSATVRWVSDDRCGMHADGVIDAKDLKAIHNRDTLVSTDDSPEKFVPLRIQSSCYRPALTLGEASKEGGKKYWLSEN